MLCGKIAAGKSTLAASLASAPLTVAIAQDFWLSRLYPGEIVSIADYLRCAPRLRAAMGPHVVDLLRLGLSVVLDFPANTPEARAWMRGLYLAAGARHRLHHLDVPDGLCRARLHRRNAAGGHDYAASDAEFDAITAMFVAPRPEEGFEIVVHAPGREEAGTPV